MEVKGVKVHCPTKGCGNKRLFDNISAMDGIISIKCPSCHAVVSINFMQVAKGKRHLHKNIK